jgi:ATP-dependent Clp protease ATP-binding subunit ClpC
MADRFDKFTHRARTVISLAQEEAIRLRHNYIGTEHLLLGLVREGNSIAANVLTTMGVDLDTIRNDVEAIIRRGPRVVKSNVGFTPRAKKVIELAVDEARRMNHHYIGTEHLLLGLAREGSGIAASVLEQEGLRLGEIRRQVLLALYNAPSSQNRSKRAMPYVLVSVALVTAGLILVAVRKRITARK